MGTDAPPSEEVFFFFFFFFCFFRLLSALTRFALWEIWTKGTEEPRGGAARSEAVQSEQRGRSESKSEPPELYSYPSVPNLPFYSLAYVIRR